jgi:hypothetical protein
MINSKGDLIISRYDENLSWLDDVDHYRKFIYNKGSNIDNTIPLPNVGREIQTYFYHIVHNYNNLSDWLFFTQANPFDHVNNYHDLLGDLNIARDTSPLTVSGSVHFLTNGVFNTTLFSESSGLPHHPPVLDLDYLWGELLEGTPPPTYPFTAGAIFISSKDIIQSRPIKFYEKCLDLSIERENGPWEFERLLPSLLDLKNETKNGL